MPEWYNYYDSNLATGALLLLPDVRGPKEKFYYQIGVQDYYKQLKAQADPNAPRQVYVAPPTRFYEHNKESEFNEFISKCENDYIKQLQKGWMEVKTPVIEDYPKDTIKEAIETLEKCNEPITLRSDMIWYEAIYFAARTIRNQQIISDFDTIFGEYQIKRYLPEGVNLSDDETESSQSLYIALMDSRNTKADQIMRGRELNGESRDFSFLK